MPSDHLPKIFITPDEEKPVDHGEGVLRHVLEAELGVRTEGTPKEKLQQRFQDQETVDEQVKRSAQELVALLRGGREMVTNVVVADDRREIRRRTEEAQLRADLQSVLQAEANEAMKKFNLIAQHWEQLDEVKDPVGMHCGLQEQRERIAELMRQKDAIIEECRRELAVADENYYRDQAKQAEEMECLVERINDHVEAMKQAYRGQLEQLQETITGERARIRSETVESWTELFDRKREHETNKLQNERQQALQDDEDLEALVLGHEELIRATKSRMEGDNECLQLELQRTKADVLINQQKLDYNFQVLKHREEENVRNQQKKRLTRLHDTIVELRRTLRETETKCAQEAGRLRTDIMKLRDQIKDLQQSASATSHVSNQKFQQCWAMNEEDCLQLARDIREISSSIYKCQLGIQHKERSDTAFVQFTDLPSFKAASEFLVASGGGSSVRSQSSGCSTDTDNKALAEMLRLVTDRTGFIHEDQLMGVLKEVKEPDSQLIRFSNLLRTFNITEQSEMDVLLAVFKKYMWAAKDADYVLESGDVYLALLELRDILRDKTPNRETHNGTEANLSRLLDAEEVKLFWRQFEEMFPDNLKQLWNGLEYGMKQYLIVLKERESLFDECEYLRNQNAELMRLLGNP